ncbi:MAG: Transcriptional repressor NrdR [Phycisphaerae bacterium]|nr:Transcriptional repressor NrdR [Phycisphaerae bacterium]
MQCPYCHVDDDRVIDSRSTDGGNVVRRRRQCNACRKRFTTYERAETETRLQVIKKDNKREPYDREKMRKGIQLACYKRPISVQQIDELINRVEESLFRRFEREVPAKAIGQEICRLLRQLDKVAYIRFASVYLQFKDIGELVNEAIEVQEEPDIPPGQQPLFDGA